ncbi:hypothetical protein F5146DRAFT_10960 [Armillaria mellea]|nr:hypothetical protein F5146DRAFT_10960 [Armillaria mellea]
MALPSTQSSVSSLNPQTAFVPAATDVWVNGLWFSSLFLSLTTALVAVLVKQWLHHYVVLPSGNSTRAVFCSTVPIFGVQKWRVEVIVGLLPVLMHLALALFFIGLSLFLHPLRAALSWVIWTGTVLLIVTYVIVTILPMCFPQCPYRTPLCDLAYPLYFYVTSLAQQHYYRLRQLLQRFSYHTPLYNLGYRPYIYITSLVQKHYHRLCQLLQHWHKNRVESVDDITAQRNSLKQLELETVDKASLRLSAEALQWLFSASSNPTVQSIVMESIGGLPMEALVEVEDVFHRSPSIVDVQMNLLSSLTEPHHTISYISSISAGMEHKFERLLRSCMFISGMEIPLFSIDIPDQLVQNEFGATLVTQIPKLVFVGPKDLKLCRPGVFLRDVLSLDTSARFPPIVWKNLIQSATDSWDPDLFNIDDQFPMLLCSAVTDAIGLNISEQQLFSSPLVVDFQHAVEYFPEMALKYMMCWLSRFDLHPGEHLECRVLAASIHLMIHRLSQLPAGTDIPKTPEVGLLREMLDALEDRLCPIHPKSTWKILESLIVDTPIFSQDAINSKYDKCPDMVLGSYSSFVQQRHLASHIHVPSSGIQLLITFITTQWSTLYTSRRTRAAFDFLISCLQWCFMPAYDVFHQQQCMKFLMGRPISPWSALLLRAYVTGITIAIHPSHGYPEESQMVSQAIDHLHKPENLFLVCSTLAMHPHTWEWIYRGTGDHDIITTLARIRPLDPAWGNCRQRLQELAEDENFFVGLEGEEQEVKKQRLAIEEVPDLEEPDIEERRCNMHKAIKMLDKFFSDKPSQATMSLKLPVPLPQPQSQLARIACLLPWSRPRQQEGGNLFTERGMCATRIPTDASSPC